MTRIALAPRYRPAHNVLVADPPWAFGDSLPGKGRGAEKHYATMTVDEICARPLPNVAPDALLFLWRVASMQPEALAVVDAWGFTLKSELVWVKRTAAGKRWFGMGRYVRSEHETCLIATRGRGLDLIRDHSVRSTFEAPVGEHSAKPDEFYAIVERLAAGPYVELYARRRRDGWTQYGNEVPDAAL